MRARLCLLGLMVVVLACVPATASATQLYINNANTTSITAFNIGPGGALTQIACTGSNCAVGDCSEQVTLTPNDQNLYATDCNNDVVSEYSVASGGSLSRLCTGACPATGSNPLGAAAAPDGKFMFVADGGGMVSPFSVGSAGTLAPISCSGCGGMNFPVGIAVSPSGQFVYVADQDAQVVFEYSVNSDGSLTPLCTSTCPSTGVSSRPFNLSVTPNGKYLYVVDSDGDRVLPFAIGSGGSLTAISCATCATGTSPQDIAVSANGNYLYTSNNGSISAFAINSDGTLAPIVCSSCDTASDYAGIVVDPSSHYVYANIDNGNDTATVAPFAIGSGGSLSPISCSPSVCTFAGGGFDISGIAASPDEAPVAQFSHSAAHAGNATRFNGSGSTAYQNATVARYDWSFGDGKNALNGGPTPKHTYAKPGRYKVTLTVTDSLGCSTQQTYTGQTMSCNGSSVATVSHTVHVTAARKARLSLTGLPRACVRAAKTIGVHVHTAGGSAPHKTSLAVDGHAVAHSRKLSFSVTLSLTELKIGSNTIKAASVDRFGRHSSVSAHITRCSTSAAFTG